MKQPEILISLKNYNLKKFIKDLSAGVIVGIVALPLAIAFAIASGVEPSRGIFTAIVAGFIISACGGSTVQIGGPTGAFVVIVYNIVQQYGYDGLAIATIMAGLFLIILGVLKLGGLVKFIPYTIITGFTSGIAITILTTQIGDFFGLTVKNMPGDFIGKIGAYIRSAGTVNFYALAVSVFSLIMIMVWPKINKKIPGSLVIIIFVTVICKVFNLPVDTIGSRYGSIPSTLPAPHIPAFTMQTVISLFPSAMSIAILAAIESLMSAVVADGMTGDKHDSDTELIAQGLANIASPLFGGIPATGAIARTATNIKNGGKTPIAGIIHTITLLLIMLFLGKYAVYIPMPALAAVLVSVAWNMAGIPAVKALLKGQKSDIAVLLVTFVLTVFVDLIVAIGYGLAMAAFFFIKKIIDVSEIEYKNPIFKGLESENISPRPEDNIAIPSGVVVCDIEGPLFFGTIRKFELAVERAEVEFKVLVLRMRYMTYLDAGGIHVLEQLLNTCKRKNITVILSGIKAQPLKLITKCELDKAIGTENIYTVYKEAMKRATELVEKK